MRKKVRLNISLVVVRCLRLSRDDDVFLANSVIRLASSLSAVCFARDESRLDGSAFR